MMAEFDPQKLPKHVAIIMDGNGRWAKQKGMGRIRGHEEGVSSVQEIVRTSRNIGIQWLTLYAFSEENWKRPGTEIAALMEILKRYLRTELPEMLENGIRFQTIGRTHKMPEEVQSIIGETIEKTSHNRDMVLTLALSYGGRQEIFDALQKIAGRIETGALSAEQMTEELISESLYTSGMPDSDLLIRTSAEYRVSNFLLWQIAYTELYVTPTLWPEFRKGEFFTALREFENRERRFGATGDQLANR